MGALECSLGIYLTRAGAEVDLARRPPAPRDADFTPEHRELLQQVFAQLGGIGHLPPLRTGHWDLWVDGTLVELDEAQHFNRYRAQTLAAPWMASLPWTDTYAAFCRAGEPACGKKAGSRGYWTSSSTEKWFGPAAPAGDLASTTGSPRWKQRALYDAVKDAYAAWSTRWPVARVSIYDEVQGVPVQKGLEGKAALDLDALRALVRTRTSLLQTP